MPAHSRTLAACAAASVQRRVALGPDGGRPIARRRDPARGLPFQFPGDGCVESGGFSLHAGICVPSGDRDALERLCRYLLRPPLSDERLSLTEDGRVVLELKTPYHDGTTHFLFEPVAFLERLAALVPPPRAHVVVYHGVLAPAAALRPEIIPRAVAGGPPSLTEGGENRTVLVQAVPDDREGSPTPSVRPRNYTWAELMKRVFAIDVLVCRCGGPRALIAVITQPAVIAAFLEALGVSAGDSVPPSARGPPGPQPISPKDLEIRFVPDAE